MMPEILLSVILWVRYFYYFYPNGPCEKLTSDLERATQWPRRKGGFTINEYLFHIHSLTLVLERKQV